MMRYLSEPLSKLGFQTLRWDLFGRGHSSAPNAIYSEQFFANQTYFLIQSLEDKNLISKNQKFHYFGHSLGGGIAVQYASQFPERIQTLMLMAPAGLPMEIPFTAKIATIPGVSWLFKFTPLGRAIMETRIPAALENPKKIFQMIFVI